jgi:hypothetical protein
MNTPSADAGPIPVWLAMADHFLDTETRPDIPLTALLCVEVGWSCERARDAWRHEVSPAVAFNLWSVAGEWAGWDRNWLVERIERLRCRWHNRPGTLRSLSYRLRAPGMDGVWVAIERCMQILSPIDATPRRERTARALAFLARHYFDFCPQALPSTPEDALGIRALYPEPFRSALRPALVAGEEAAAEARLQALLRRASRP